MGTHQIAYMDGLTVTVVYDELLWIILSITLDNKNSDRSFQVTATNLANGRSVTRNIAASDNKTILLPTGLSTRLDVISHPRRVLDGIDWDIS